MACPPKAASLSGSQRATAVWADFRRDERRSDFACDLQGLRHPNIVTFCGASLHSSGESFLVTELMPYNLSDVLYSLPNVQLQPAHVRNVALDVARACRYMHARSPQLIHRCAAAWASRLRSPASSA